MMMNFKLVILPTDFLIYLLVLVIIAFALWARTKEHLRAPWRQVMRNKLGLVALTILSFYIAIGLMDSIHFRQALPQTSNGHTHYATQVKSLFDIVISPLGEHTEKTYSAPFATHLFTKETIEQPDGSITRSYPQLKYAATNLQKLNRTKAEDITLRILKGLTHGLIFSALYILIYLLFLSIKNKRNIFHLIRDIFTNKTDIPYRVLFITLVIVYSLLAIALELSREYHIFGTDKVGQDVFYESLKSIRTGLVIGTLTTLVMLPFALLLGTMAGYYGGLMDDVIQYIYTTLSSIPGVLLIAASILSIQIFISNNQSLFPTIAQRADARLLALCIILGITSWTSLCRLLRGETLKLREMDYVTAATALGVSKFKTLTRHIMPNVMHIVIISIVLDFSGLVLAEAILSYVGVGVDPSTISWGNMINSARLELAREPIVWWPLAAAFVFMFVLVLCANLFSDAVRDAFDPRLRTK